MTIPGDCNLKDDARVEFDGNAAVEGNRADGACSGNPPAIPHRDILIERVQHLRVSCRTLRSILAATHAGCRSPRLVPTS